MSSNAFGGSRGPKTGGTRLSVTLSCMTCGARNYKTTRARRPNAEPLVLKKFCKQCNQHTEHREAR